MPDEDRQVRPFADWLQDQRSGALTIELADGLNDLVEAVALHGKAGTLTLVVKVAPAGKNGHTVVVTDDVKVKAPEAERGESIFFVDPDCNLTREIPGQERLPLREVPSDPAPLRHVPKEA